MIHRHRLPPLLILLLIHHCTHHATAQTPEQIEELHESMGEMSDFDVPSMSTNMSGERKDNENESEQDEEMLNNQLDQLKNVNQIAPVSFIPKEGSKETLKDEHGRPMYRLGVDHENQQSEEQRTRKERKPQTCHVNDGCTYEELDCDLQYEGERLYCFDRFIVGKLYINNLPDTLIRLEINDNAITSIDPRTFVNGECS